MSTSPSSYVANREWNFRIWCGFLFCFFFETTCNHFNIWQVSFKRKRPVQPVSAVLYYNWIWMDVCVSLRRIKIITKPGFQFLLPKAFRRALYHTGDLLHRGACKPYRPHCTRKVRSKEAGKTSKNDIMASPQE